MSTTKLCDYRRVRIGGDLVRATGSDDGLTEADAPRVELHTRMVRAAKRWKELRCGISKLTRKELDPILPEVDCARTRRREARKLERATAKATTGLTGAHRPIPGE